jgi:hypothetical protein
MTSTHHNTTEATSGAVAKPNSSAPSKAAMATSRPVLTDHHILKQRDFVNHLILRFVVLLQDLVPNGIPVCCKEVKGAAPVPPSNQILKSHRFALQPSSDRSYTNF